jgi:hypothetical protein
MTLHRIATTVVALSALAGAFASNAAANGTPKNGLSDEAFRANALTTNVESLKILRSNALTNALFDDESDYLHGQLQEPNARAVMEDLVKCAFGPEESLSYNEFTWSGEYGLCDDTQNPQQGRGDWSTHPPTKLCQQLVTSCLMASVNAVDKAIPLSFRGAPSGLSLTPLFKPAPAVSPQTRLREGPAGEDPTRGSPIKSFTVCQGMPNADGKHPDDCGWLRDVDNVGRCAPGTTVRLKIQNPSRPFNCARASIRICQGIHGCDSMTNLSYSKYDRQDDTCTSEVKFSCPAMAGVEGAFSVMLRSDPKTDQRQTVTLDEPSRSIWYPATEKQVFGFREGAFYGNLFDQNALLINCSVEPGKPLPPRRYWLDWPRYFTEKQTGKPTPLKCAPAKTASRRSITALPYQKVYACYDAELPSHLAMAYFNQRFCAAPDGSGGPSDCFPHPTRPCNGPSPNNACTWSEDMEFHNCSAPTPDSVVYPAITTYLNEPCDLINSKNELCAPLRRAFAKRRTVEPKLTEESSHRGGCGGCGAGGAGGVLPPASLAALVALAFHMRRRYRVR